MEKYYRIHYGCGCGDNEDYMIAENEEEAMAEARGLAIEDYESYEGLHGIRSMSEIAMEDFDVDLDELEYDSGEYISIETEYYEERESQLDYWVDEITEEEYLIGIGKLGDDDE